MNKRYTGIVLILVFLLTIPLQSYAATPMETVKTGVNKMLDTLGDPAFKAKARDEQIAQLGEIIETVFDFNELSKRTLGREWRKMNAEQRKEFVQLFQELLQGVYADRLLAYSDQKVLFEKETMLKRAGQKSRAICRPQTAKRFRSFIG